MTHRWRWWPHADSPFLQTPTRCEVCQSWPSEPAGQPVCGACLSEFAPHCSRCRRCATTLTHLPDCGACVLQPPPLAHCVAAVDYAFPWSGLLHRFKFRGETGWARVFAQLMVDAPGASRLLEASDWLLPIPLNSARLGERGYNQSWELCKAIAASTCGRPHPEMRSDVLIKIVDTQPQHEIGREERLHNLENAFALHPAAIGQIPGRRITLIDDIMTTGATLHAAARVLRQAGALEVNAWILARTPER